MPITLTQFSYSGNFHGFTWKVNNEDLLAEQIARIALGQSRHVKKILNGVSAAPSSALAQDVAQAAIKLLEVAGSDPSHRDGWMFQAMSWIAANKATPGCVIRTPHIRAADKGLDGLQIVIDVKTNIVAAAIIFEDKATGNARDVIRDEVWEEFGKLEEGSKDNVLVAEVTSLLETQHGIDIDAAMENIVWKQARYYRVSITVEKTHTTDKGRMRLFKDYEKVATGTIDRRRGETVYIPQLRQWMDQLAKKAIVFINNQPKK